VGRHASCGRLSLTGLSLKQENYAYSNEYEAGNPDLFLIGGYEIIGRDKTLPIVWEKKREKKKGYELSQKKCFGGGKLERET